RAGLASGEISVRFQPVVRLLDGRPILVEALARWRGRGGAIGPEAFVPLAERSGLARALAFTVASQAAAELGGLPRPLGLGVTVNLSLPQLLKPDLAAWLRRATAGTGLRSAQVTLELTETVPVRDRALLRRALLRLRWAGHGVLLDDLLMGDARARLLALPFAGFKLDRSLVEALPRNARARREVQRLVRGAARRGQLVIAEGISDRRLWAAVQGLGVTAAQGFAVGRPLPSAALLAWRAGWRSGRNRRAGRARA
ncbi:MAG TPA: EAL domain-containing protein, partial [Crenalkalicoccus sp.]|nr:EAL domain-containing protein [Crenalkalicoccus sp.]